MLDEPSQGLAPLVVDELFKIIEQVNGQGIAVLLVEQNVKRALKISRRGYVLENGRIVIEGKAEDLLKNETVKKTYLGL
jgi:branched-chain amino acid transport system ATP-binding protein